jgi:hypothetical protein
MDASVTPAGVLEYTERDVTALLDSRGGRLYWYFWVMLSDQTSVTRALAGTVIVALPDPGPRELFEVAHAVCRQHHPAPAVPYARAEAPTLAAATRAALRRLEPDDREICVLGASAYGLNDADLAAVLRIAAVEEHWSGAMDAFAFHLAACAADAGLEQGGDLVERALRLFGAAQFALPYDEIVRLATDPAAQWLREGIRARVGIPNRAAAQQGGMELLGTGSNQSVTVQGMEDADFMTVPLPRVPRKGAQHAGSRRRGAMAGTVLAAGVIPVALAVAWAGYSSEQGGVVSAVPPLSATVGSPHGGAAQNAGGSAIPSSGYHARHSRQGTGAQHAGTSSGSSGSSGITGTSGISGTSGASGTSGTSSYMQAPSVPTYATAPAAPAPAPTVAPVPVTTTPPPAPAPAPSPTPTKPGKGVGRGK